MNKTPCYFYDKNSFSWTKLLEKNWKLILEELCALLQKQEKWTNAHPHYVKNIKNEMAWKTFEFIFFGIKNRENCNKCHKTYDLIKSIPVVVTAQFSIMHPNTHILPHKGYSRMILRSHLGLIIPNKTKCKIRVGDETKSWEKGKIIIFDDSYEHEAWNKSDKQRVVLMIDIANPEWNYTADQICRYKIENISDPFLLNVANKKTWMKWLNQGYFS
jgi:ornithine lipid ester-linked acyl 2-hydroxylase